MSRILASALLVLSALPAAAAETSITVRARAHDAKFIGTGVGGVRVLVRAADTGRLLATGRIEGGTGDTDALMRQAHGRRDALAGPAAAGYTAVVDIDEPTRVEISLEGPLAGGDGAPGASQTLWVLPDHDVVGDGVVFELRGLLVHPVTPAPHQPFGLGQSIPVEVQVTMLCGCPVESNGLWDTSEFRVEAVVERGGEEVVRVPLAHSGTPSRFTGDLGPLAAGSYRVRITAAQEAAGNYGVGVTGLVVK